MQGPSLIYSTVLFINIVAMLTSSLPLISSNTLTYIGLVPEICFSTLALSSWPSCSFMGKIFEPMLFTNSKLNLTKIQGYNPLRCKNKHIPNKHPCLPVVFVREINGDGMGVVLNSK